ncbi:MAG TPA: hypothetical protein VHN11_04945 [Xanthobacteraceae bacterium]|jgi:hypothetical protein|nr:hypothetical protein [Xanthobacteraceae bacterium]
MAENPVEIDDESLNRLCQFLEGGSPLLDTAGMTIRKMQAQRKAVAEVLSGQGCECAEDVDMMHVGTDRCTACQVSNAMGWIEE